MSNFNSMNSLTIVMYHYVRDLKKTTFPKIKGLDISLFEEQLKYIKRFYNVISGFELIEIINSKSKLPPKAMLLTFDDGYSDHFFNVYPLLKKYNLSGIFFPPAECITANKVLDVNKIHFILASIKNEENLIQYINNRLDEYRDAYNLESNEFYMSKLGKKNRWDSAKIIFIKRILQLELPEKLRKIIIDDIFEQYVTNDIASFSKELYMNVDQISSLHSDGMYIGSHAYSHRWLNHLNEEEQKIEINSSLDFLKKIGNNTKDWIMCYPYGGYNDTTLKILENYNCRLGLTTKVGIANLKQDNLLTLPRLDTNDLPKNSNANPNKWFLKT